MATTREQSVELAIQAQLRLRDIHNQVGDFPSQSGAVISNYERARRQLETNPLELLYVRQIFTELRQDIQEFSRTTLLKSEQIGMTQAKESFALYNEEYPEPESDEDLVTESLDGIDSLIQRQLATYIVLLLSGEVSRDLLIGSNRNWGILNPRPIITTVKNFATNMVNSVLSRVVTGQPGMGYQAVAILDKKTSPCCRAVDGQVQPIGRPFHLTEPPNYAEYMIKPPFHDGCRTTRALVRLDEVSDLT